MNEHEACCESCDGECMCHEPMVDPRLIGDERNRYFTGKHMTAREFRDEQIYLMSHQRLHTRVLHGWGIVCGLEVVAHRDDQCAKEGWVIVNPGIAMDCWGREIVVKEPRPIHLRALLPDNVPPGCEKTHESYDAENHKWALNKLCETHSTILLGIRYGELAVEPVPVLVDDKQCGQRTAMNRIREKPCYRYQFFTGASPCWDEPKHSCEAPAEPNRKSLDEYLKSLGAEVCGGLVPLAKCHFGADVQNQNSCLPTIDMTGRRYLEGPLSPRQLTRICKINWHHAKDTPFGNLRQDIDIKAHPREFHLVIRFTQALAHDLPKHEDDPLGRYWRILRVTYELDDGQPHWFQFCNVLLSECKRELHCFIDLQCAHHLRHHDKAIIHVTLNCDFLTDEYGRAVDGNHLHGSLGQDNGCPTGDGVEGGIFESWFRLTDLYQHHQGARS